mgnify:CR=1 FL=1
MIIKLNGKEVSYTELFGAFFNKSEKQKFIIEDVHPFNELQIKIIEE